MFRRGLPDSAGTLVKEGTNAQYHPFFDYVEFTSKSIDEMEFSLSTIRWFTHRGYERFPSLKVDSLPCLEEYATSPPSRDLVFLLLPFNTYPEARIRLHRETGVKVKDVLEGIFNLLESDTPASYRNRFLRELQEEVDAANDPDFGSDSPPTDAQRQREELLKSLTRGNSLSWRQTITPSERILSLAQEVKIIRDDCVGIQAVWTGH
jgi:hypothetical protein